MKRIVHMTYAAWVTETLMVDIPDDMPREQWAEFVRSPKSCAEMIESTGAERNVDDIPARFHDDDGPF